MIIYSDFVRELINFRLTIPIFKKMAQQEYLSWIEQVLDSTDEAESPRSFFFWSSLVAISCAVSNRVWLPKPPPNGLYRLYPNLYVLLVAKSGACRKGLPIDVAKQLVKLLGNIKVISGRNSIQQIIQELAFITKSSTGKRLTEATAGIFSGEFATLLIKDPDALTILTDLYDSHYNSEWKYTTKGSGEQILKNSCISMLGGLNQAHFRDILNEKDIEGGFLARCIVIYETKRFRKNSLMKASEKDLGPETYERLSAYLKTLSNLSGPFTVTDEAIKIFDTWYQEYDPEKLDDRTGTANRVHDHILKTAMLISLSHRRDLVIDVPDMQLAMTSCLEMTKVSGSLSEGKGKAKFGGQMAALMQYLLDLPEHKISKKKLLQRFYGEFDANDLDGTIIPTMEAMGYIIESKSAVDSFYRLPENIVKEYEEHQRKTAEQKEKKEAKG